MTLHDGQINMFQNPFRFGENLLANGQSSGADIFEGVSSNDVIESTNSTQQNPNYSFEENSSDSIIFERLDSYDDSISSDSLCSSLAGDMESTEVTLFGPKPANNLMMLSLLEHLCTLYVDSEEMGQQLFENLCKKLCGMKLIQNFGTLDNARAIRQKYQAAFVGMMDSALETLNPSSLNPEKIWQLANKRNVTQLSLHSWYKDMFHEEKLIAHGGFGEVCQAKNKLDQKVYAIKKVKLVESQPDICQRTLREVNVFSNLNHPNVVRYHSSWLEYGFTEFTSLDNEDVTDGLNSSENRFTPPPGPSELVSLDVDLFGSHFGNFNVGLLKEKSQKLISYKKSTENLNDGVFLDETDGTPESNENNDDTQSVCSSPDEKPTRKRTPSLGRSFSSGDVPLHHTEQEEISYCRGKFYDSNLRKALNMTLFIQMELCQLTLRQWIDERNQSTNQSLSQINKRVNLEILKQILLAIKYIHDEGLIHRDIKPANIFLNFPEKNMINLKIGDFGLARDDISPKTPTGHFDQTDAPFPCNALHHSYLSHTIGVGTAVYAAPEQKFSRYYSNKVDIFSVGIIMFELFQPFNTDMERLKSFDELMNVPTCGCLEQTWKEESELILEMTLKDPDKRPTAESLLKSSLLTDNFNLNNIDELKKKLTSQELEIKKLRTLLLEAEAKICLQCQTGCKHIDQKLAYPS